MACGICAGAMNDCPVCGAAKASRPEFASWEERLDARRDQPSLQDAHITLDNMTGAAKQGQYVVDTGGDRTGPKYSRGFNSGYDGPGKGTW